MQIGLDGLLIEILPCYSITKVMLKRKDSKQKSNSPQLKTLTEASLSYVL